MEVAVLAEKVNRLGFWLFAAVYFGVTACGLTLAVRASQPRYHYEVRQDLSVHFDNADKVIEKVRSRLKERQKVIRITYSAKNSSLDDTEKLVHELMQFACAETDCPDEGDYIGCQLGGYNSAFTEERTDDGHKNVIEITPIYFPMPRRSLKPMMRSERSLKVWGFLMMRLMKRKSAQYMNGSAITCSMTISTDEMTATDCGRRLTGRWSTGVRPAWAMR